MSGATQGLAIVQNILTHPVHCHLITLRRILLMAQYANVKEKENVRLEGGLKLGLVRVHEPQPMQKWRHGLFVFVV